MLTLKGDSRDESGPMSRNEQHFPPEPSLPAQGCGDPRLRGNDVHAHAR